MTEEEAAATTETTETKEFEPEIAEIVDRIEKLNALKLGQLKEAIEDRFGVTAAAGGPIMAMPAADAGAAVEEEPTEFDVFIKAIGDKKIQVIKEVRAITSLGLKEAKAAVDDSPDKPVKEKVTKEDAEKYQKLIEEAGATVEIKPAK
jgi:large subunit ribosomal protein L7/L12